MTKHEMISCERCGTRIECRANTYSRCQCNAVHLSAKEVEHIAENYEGCLCASCLNTLKAEYQLLAELN